MVIVWLTSGWLLTNKAKHRTLTAPRPSHPPVVAALILAGAALCTQLAMPPAGPFSLHSQTMYPALYLYPLNDSFIPKHIALSNQQRVKIGRQTSAKTIPAERNGYFDSKVLSRQHAEVWEESGKARG